MKPHSSDQQPISWDDAAIRAAYERYGVEGFYQRLATATATRTSA